MILKIERYRDNQKWWIYDDIKKISISNKMYHSKHGIEVPGEVDIDAVFLDIQPPCECGPNDIRCDSCVAYYTLICRLTNGEEFSIAFDTVAYLLNDDGKTIEKILANYSPEVAHFSG